MLKRAPTRIELKPEDRQELDEMQKLRKQNKWPPQQQAQQAPEQRDQRTAAQRIGFTKPSGSLSPFR
jgi:hypothetical protein